MKILRKITSFLLILSVCLSLSFCLSSCEESKREEDITSLPITESDKTPVKYSAEFISTEAKRLYTCLEEKIKAEYGNKLPISITLLENSFGNALSALEARGVSEADAKSIVDNFITNEVIFDKFINAVKNKSDSLPLDAAYMLFSETVLTLGVKNASLFIYDIFGVYCSYMSEKYITLYNKTPSLTYLYRTAAEWLEKSEKIKKIGEDNFSYLLRAGMSLVSVNSLAFGNGGEFFLKLSGGELAIFLKTEGELLSKISLTNEDVVFITEELGNAEIPIFKAIAETKDTERVSLLFSDLKAFTVDILTNIDKDCCDAILAKNASLAIYNATRNFDEDDWARLSRIISGTDEEKYKQYFTKNKQIQDYLNFKKGINAATLEDVKSAEQEEFLTVLKNYVSSASPAWAFLIF